MVDYGKFLIQKLTGFDEIMYVLLNKKVLCIIHK